MIELNSFYCCDYREIINIIPDNSLIISDPPYNIGYNYNEYSDILSEVEYTKLFKPFKKFSSVFINYPEETIRYICKALGTPEEIVTWVYSSNINRQHRMISWYNCNPDFNKVKQPYKNINDKRVKKLIEKGVLGAKIYDWWNIDLVKNVSKQKEKYCNQIPEEVIYRIIKTTASKECVIVDPFCGSGTVCAVAEKLGYKWIGIDISQEAIDISKKRIENVNPLFAQKN